MGNSGVLDSVDRALVHALHVDGRAPFSRIAEVLGVSEHTVARRYRRLRAEGILRVVGVLDGTRTGTTSWAVRLTCTPDAAIPVAEALARRPDTVWVRLLSGGTEIACGITGDESDDVLLRKLPRTPRIVAMSAHETLHLYAGWRSRTSELTEAQTRHLALAEQSAGEVEVTPGDLAMVRVLAGDGRAGHAELAAASGWSQSTVRRRLELLRGSGVLRFDVEVPPSALGYRAEAWLWMKVRPSHLASVGAALAAHPEVDVAAATTGPSNLMAGVTCVDTRDLYRYLTERVAPLDGVRELETSPVVRTLKRAGKWWPR